LGVAGIAGALPGISIIDGAAVGLSASGLLTGFAFLGKNVGSVTTTVAAVAAPAAADATATADASPLHS
jgi:hypothetical protein